MAKMVKVQATNKENKVGLFEKNEAHPQGEAFVYGNGDIVEVAMTSAVKRAIASGSLTTEVDESRVQEKKTRTEEVPALRNATDQEEDNAGLTTPTEKETAKVPVSEGGIRRGGRPG